MKREIKFRTWFGSRFSVPDVMEYFDLQTLIDRPDYQSTIDGEVMQYSGFKDKNGEEIYEGDIVLFKANYTNKRCGWIEGVFVYDENNYYKPGLKVGYDVYEIGEETDEFPYTCEVVGNIYEDSELLNKKQEKNMMSRNDNKKEVYLGIEHLNKGKVVDLKRGMIKEWDLMWWDIHSVVRGNCKRWMDKGYSVVYVGDSVVILIYNK
jgi:uncharacterized phage protein (TIGR01671 family)